ncbi:efflux RND transporter periplasmic adaptor subunit [Kiloniella litopenaei]|uniref:efflux RND transporter periplasmic adaptor subunit n=1 Tax=Kiloniella litopenaei TaxID=1549748 RepID=UPI000696294B|nr:efflux RND transporter periplasmic adaptor subunit [Kiloniella litopenaei]
MKVSYLLAFILAVGTAGWVMSGQLSDSSEAGEAGQPEIKKPPVNLDQATKTPSVRVQTKTAVPYTRYLTVRGRTEALRTVEIKSEASGKIIDLAIDKGDIIEAGKLVAKLDVNERAAKVQEFKALKEQRSIEYKAAKRLSQKGFKAETKLAASKAALESAEAELRRAQVALSNTLIPAPFTGVLNSRAVEIGEYIDVGDKIGTIIDLSTILVVSDVSERLVPYISVGHTANVRLITGQTVEGKVRYIASMADANTRTFRIEVAVPNPDMKIADGITAETVLTLNDMQAHKVSSGILTINANGTIGVKTLTPDNTIEFKEASILENTTDGLWLGGLPKEVTFVVIGQELIKDGQKVKAIDADTLEELTPVTPTEPKQETTTGAAQS